MSDNKPTVNINDNSPEEVAFKLMHQVARLEGRAMATDGKSPADRQWLLDTYAECLATVRGQRALT
jgi:hypothetical protein